MVVSLFLFFFRMPRPAPIQLRLFVEDDHNCVIAAQRLANLITSKGLIHSGFYFPDYRSRLVVFNFNSQQSKEQVLNLENLDNKLRSLHFRPIDRNSEPNASHRTVFVNNLNPCHFYFWSPEEGGSDDESLTSKKAALIEDLKHQPEGADIEKFHFNNLYDNNFEEKPPKTLKLTFKSVAAADRFIKMDTFLTLAPILARNKRWNTNIPIRQCGICKKTDHARGSPQCDRKLRCPRCLSEEHSTPPSTLCEMRCHTHGTEGRRPHITSSSECEVNRNYVKLQRQQINRRDQIVNNTANTPNNQRQLHADLLRLNNNLNRNRNLSTNPHSFAAAVRYQPQPSIRTPNSAGPIFPPAGTSTLTSNNNGTPVSNESTVMAAALVAASMSELLEPGTFQSVMDDYYLLNGLPCIKHPIPSRAVMNFYANPSARPTLPSTLPTTLPSASNPSSTPGPSSITPQGTTDSTDASPPSVANPISQPHTPTPSPKSSPVKSKPTAVTTNERDPRLAASYIQSLTHDTEDESDEDITDPRFLTQQEVPSPAVTRNKSKSFEITDVSNLIDSTKDKPIIVDINLSKGNLKRTVNYLIEQNYFIMIRELLPLVDTKTVSIKFNNELDEDLNLKMLKFAITRKVTSSCFVDFLFSRATQDFIKNPKASSPSRT